MKDFLKTIKLIIISELVIIFGYLFLHEVGHAIIAKIFGIKIIEFKLFPSAYVLCDISASINKFVITKK